MTASRLLQTFTHFVERAGRLDLTKHSQQGTNNLQPSSQGRPGKNSLKQIVRQCCQGSPRKRLAAVIFFFQKHMQCNVTALFPSLPKSACVLCVRPHFHECTVVMRTCLHHQIPSVQPLYSKLWQDYSYQSVADLGSVPTLSIQLLNVCDVNCHCVGLEAILTQLGWW